MLNRVASRPRDFDVNMFQLEFNHFFFRYCIGWVNEISEIKLQGL